MREVSFDTETWYVAERHGANGGICPPLVCGAFSDGSESTICDKKDTLRTISNLLDDHSVRLVGHNICFDLAVVQKEAPELAEKIFNAYEANRITDTMLREKLLDIAKGSFTPRGYSLQALAEKWLGLKLEKEDTWRLRYKELDGISLLDWPPEAIEYALKDADTTYKVYQAQGNSSFLLEDQYRQARGAFWMYLMSAHGITTEPSRVADLEEKTEERLEQDRDLLVEKGIVERVYK